MTPSRQYALISNALDAALEYADKRAAVDYWGQPNEALKVCTEIEQAQAALEELRKSDSEETIMGDITCPR